MCAHFTLSGYSVNLSPVDDLSDSIRQFCSKNRLKLNTDLGQHFLVDQHVLDEIVAAAAIQQGDRVVEIGPGIGVLTKELLAHTPNVTVIELDDRLIPLLKEYTGSDGLDVIQGNALEVEMPDDPYKIVANIPYHITSPLLRHVFLESKQPPQTMTLLIQREVAERICDEKDAGLLTILVGLFGSPRIVTSVPPEAFLPPPKVDSAVLHIDCFREPIANQETIEKIFILTKKAFSQKRKMLSNTIDTELLEKAAIDPQRRPQTLSVEEWIQLAKI